MQSNKANRYSQSAYRPKVIMQRLVLPSLPSNRLYFQFPAISKVAFYEVLGLGIVNWSKRM